MPCQKLSSKTARAACPGGCLPPVNMHAPMCMGAGPASVGLCWPAQWPSPDSLAERPEQSSMLLGASAACSHEPAQHVAKNRCPLQDGLWHTAIGTMESCLGTAALYTSPDYKTWTSSGTWTDQVGPLHVTDLPSNKPDNRIWGQLSAHIFTTHDIRAVPARGKGLLRGLVLTMGQDSSDACRSEPCLAEFLKNLVIVGVSCACKCTRATLMCNKA